MELIEQESVFSCWCFDVVELEFELGVLQLLVLLRVVVLKTNLNLEFQIILLYFLALLRISRTYPKLDISKIWPN